MERDPRLDPDGRYPSQGARIIETRASPLVDWRAGTIVARTRDVIELRFVDPADSDDELVVIVGVEAMELRLPRIEWTLGPYGPAMSSTLWRRVKWPDDERADMRPWLDRLARALHRSKRRCQDCHERFVPSRMVDGSCHGCAASLHHVVF